MSPSPSLLVYITHPNLEQARELAHQCLEAKLIACANILPPANSLYRWQGKICEDREWVLIFKTDQQHFSALEQLIKRHHPYDCPCILGLAVEQGSTQYQNWLRDCLDSD